MSNVGRWVFLYALSNGLVIAFLLCGAVLWPTLLEAQSLEFWVFLFVMVTVPSIFVCLMLEAPIADCRRAEDANAVAQRRIVELENLNRVANERARLAEEELRRVGNDCDLEEREKRLERAFADLEEASYDEGYDDAENGEKRKTEIDCDGCGEAA